MQTLIEATRAGVHAASAELQTVLTGGAAGAAVGALIEAGDVSTRTVIGAAVGALIPVADKFAVAFLGVIRKATA